MIDALLVFSSTVALTCFFFWVLLEKGFLPALLVLFLPLLPLIIIVIVVICKAIYGLHGIFGIFVLMVVACVLLTPITLVVGILLDIGYGIDIFRFSRFKKKKPITTTKGYTKPKITKVTRSRREPNEFREENWYPVKKIGIHKKR